MFFSEVNESELKGASSSEISDNIPSISLSKKIFGGKYAVAAEEFTGDMVSASVKKF